LKLLYSPLEVIKFVNVAVTYSFS